MKASAAGVDDVVTETGYVGHLTREQETKLGQLWGLLLDAFKPDAAEPSAAAAPDPGTAGPRPRPDRAPSDHQVDVGQRAVGREREVRSTKLRKSWLAMLKHEDPDALLLRFLRARKWDVTQASSMLINALLWRCEQARVDEEVLPRGEPWCARTAKTSTGAERKEAGDLLDQYRAGKVYLRGVDRRGRPVGYIHLALHRPGMQSQETLQKLVVQTIETARCLFTDSSKEAAFCLVFDLTGFSLSNMVRFSLAQFSSTLVASPRLEGRLGVDRMTEFCGSGR
ncbi:hypothetical protein ONZ43_g6042 [Nemania bipapillata]|uniref:Uncharacterized protein n=1 Tax=Nemania bipapillata TaxID=110536 RepID=A0ACC2I353_9PEZI|nr:hypothetical protein ONZ43_g6042 [Nemania bipapillata]